MRRTLFFTALLVVAAASSAAPITYNLTINTSSIAGTSGSLDFNFNPGTFGSQAASVQIVNFSSDGSLGTAILTGDASGALPSTVTFDNGTPFNDYFQTFKFGSTLSFGVSLYGPALSSPNGTAKSGSTFAFSMFSNAAGTVPVLTSNTSTGFAYVVNVNLDGTTSATSFITNIAPEPSSWFLVGMPIALGALFFRRNSRSVSSM